MKFGHIKVLAHRYLKGEPIPLFRDNAINRAIDRHVARIRAARTRRSRRG